MAGSFIGKTIANVGNWLNLPEMGRSENWGVSVPTRTISPIPWEQANRIGMQAWSAKNPQPTVKRVTGNTGTTLGANTNAINQQASAERNYELLNTQTPTGGESGVPLEQSMLQQLQGNLNSGYDEIFGYLDNMANLLPGWLEEKQKTVGDLFGSQQTGLESSQQTGLNKIENWRGDIKADQSQNLKSLSESLRNWTRAGINKLGAWGAGASSAAPMYQFALAKEAGKRGTDIARQVQDMFSDLRDKETTVRDTFAQGKSKLEEWKSTQLSSVQDWYQGKIEDINTQKMNATASKMDALNQMTQQAMSSAIEYLRGIQDQATQWDSAMKEWAVNRMASIDDANQQLSGVQYSPQDVTWNELQGLGSQPTGASADYSAWNPYTKKAKETESQLNSWIG